jgi:hypothetical protein
VDSQRRYDSLVVPDVDTTQALKGSLSYTIRDFVSNDTAIHGAVVTCFFLDTATVVYDYIHQIRKQLSPAGIWINVGPLQWHRNAELMVSADELRLLVQEMGFTVLHWSVDRQPVEYRGSDQEPRSTHYDAYCPLRFVLRKGTT